eukprot:4991675-Amphidinium_carterae.1
MKPPLGGAAKAKLLTPPPAAVHLPKTPPELTGAALPPTEESLLQLEAQEAALEAQLSLIQGARAAQQQLLA